jgi:hypothetical protein
MELRRLIAATLACFFAGCAVSAETTGGQLNQIKAGMTREQVIGSLGEPARTSLLNGALSSDVYACDEQGQIMVVKQSKLGTLAGGLLFPLGLVDSIKFINLTERSSECAIRYDQGRVVSTSQTMGIVFTPP